MKSRFLALMNCRNLTDLDLRTIYIAFNIDRNHLTEVTSYSLRRGDFKKVTTLVLCTQLNLFFKENNELSGSYTNEILLSLAR